MRKPAATGSPAERKKAQAPSPKPPSRPVVFNSPWNGSVAQVERYLKQNLYDASSFEALEWGKVVEMGQGFQVRCTYRSKNLLGVVATQTKTFLLNSKGEIDAVKD